MPWFFHSFDWDILFSYIWWKTLWSSFQMQKSKFNNLPPKPLHPGSHPQSSQHSVSSEWILKENRNNLDENFCKSVYMIYILSGISLPGFLLSFCRGYKDCRLESFCMDLYGIVQVLPVCMINTVICKITLLYIISLCVRTASHFSTSNFTSVCLIGCYSSQSSTPFIESIN